MICASDWWCRQDRHAGSWPGLARIVVAVWTLTAAVAGADSHRLQDYRIARWTTAEGLPQNTINDIIALPNGELWLATFGGLVRFDGARFEVIDIAGDAGLASNRITALEPAGADAAWFVTQEGHLGRLEGGRVRTLVWPASPMSDVIGLVSAGGRFYSQTHGGGLFESNGTAAWRVATQVPRPGVGGLNFLIDSARAEDRWAWTDDAVTRVSGRDTGPRIFPARGLPITSGHGRDLWLGVPGRLGRLVDDRLEWLDVRPAITTDINVILHVSDTELWVAGAGVVSQVTATPEGTWVRAELPLDLPPGLFIRALALDSEGSLWIGTNGRGLYRANRQPTRRFGREAGLEAIVALASDGADGAWAGGNCNGIYHIDGAGALTPVHRRDESTPGGLGNCEYAFAPAPGGELWVRWWDHVYRVQRTEPRVRVLPLRVPNDFGPVVPAPDGTLWVISRKGDVRRISNDRVLAQLTLPAPLVSAAIGPDGTLWVGGTGEVFHVRSNGLRGEHIGPREGVPRGSIRDLLPEPDGTLWIATYGGGLGRLREGRVMRFTVDDGLPDNALSRILDDGRGRLWLATNRGIAVLDRRELAEAAGTRRILTPVVLGAERGVPEANFGLPAGFADRQGRLWFGTIEGVVRVDASRFPFNPVAPTVRVEAVLADDRPLPLAPVVPIPPGTARVRLNFTAVALLYPERMRFRVRIDGIDRDWVDVGAQRFATFTPGGPGQHRFLLQVRNEDGVWSTAPVVIDLDVLPAWWQTRTARLAGLAGIGLLAFAFYRQRVGLLERRHADRVRALEDRRRSEEQATALRSQLEHVSRLALAGELAASLAHEVNQPLTAIVANAEAGQHMLAAGAMRDGEFGELLNDIVVQGLRASEVIRGLREFLRAGHPDARPVDLSQIVHEMLPLVRREFEDNGVRVQLHLADDLPPVEGRRVQLGQIVVNLLMNACEALARVNGDRIVEITTRAREGRVELLVRDSGPGLLPEVADRIFEPFVSTKSQGMGMGLAICRSIADAHRGRLTAEATREGGLTMVLSLPGMAAPSAVSA